MLADSPNGSASSIGSYGSKRLFIPLNAWLPSLADMALLFANGAFCAGGIGGCMLCDCIEFGGKGCGYGPGPAD